MGLRNIWEMEAAFAIKYSMCLELSDFLLRRSPLFLSQADHGLGLVDGIARVFQSAYNWSDSDTLIQKQKYQEHLRFELGWRES